ncbi:MAG: L-histidine N(alpha)-methyltransferase [Pseudomonadota bacterium]
MIDAQDIDANLRFFKGSIETGDAKAELLEGLLRQPKRVNPKWFYDERGSRLFDEITRLPEYYPTRTETRLLVEHAADMATYCAPQCLLIEPGSGSCDKARLLLDAMRPATYLPIDISAEFLLAAARRLGADYPWLQVDAICADFTADWSFLDAYPRERRVVFYPGSTIGNLEPEAALEFLRRIRSLLEADGCLLIGVDTHKSVDILNAAYNDAQGVTAAFNLNLLQRLNRELGADFNAEQFEHSAFYNASLQRIEMHLKSRCEQTVHYEEGELRFAEAESIHTENSYKYTSERFSALAHDAGFEVAKSWYDEQQLFGVHCLQPVHTG